MRERKTPKGASEMSNSVKKADDPITFELTSSDIAAIRETRNAPAPVTTVRKTAFTIENAPKDDVLEEAPEKESGRGQP